MLIYQFKIFANCFLKVIIQSRLSGSPQTSLNLRRGVVVENIHFRILEKKQGWRRFLPLFPTIRSLQQHPGREKRKTERRLEQAQRLTNSSGLVTGFK